MWLFPGKTYYYAFDAKIAVLSLASHRLGGSIPAVAPGHQEGPHTRVGEPYCCSSVRIGNTRRQHPGLRPGRCCPHADVS